LAGDAKTDLTEAEFKFGDWTQQVQDSHQMQYIVRMVNDLRFQYEQEHFTFEDIS